MAGLIRVLHRVGGTLWTALLPAVALLAALGAAFLLAPGIEFREYGDDRIQSRVYRTDAPDGALTFETRTDATEAFHPRTIHVAHTRAVRPAPINAVDADLRPVGGVRLRNAVVQGWRTRSFELGVGWLAAWAAGLSALWWAWAAWTGRFAAARELGEERPGGWAAPVRAVLGRAARPWLAGLAVLGGLSLASPLPLPGGRTLLAEARRDPHTPWHPRALWIAWEEPNPKLLAPRPMPPAPGSVAWMLDAGAPAKPLWGAPEWGLRMEKARIAPALGCSDRDASRGGRPRWAAAISLWWLAAPLALCSAVSLRRSVRSRPEPPGGGSSVR